tara:strand:- start:2942 stop:4870 length:1929 start_codon:yes stop_codon:yes gene_type:complete
MLRVHPHSGLVSALALILAVGSSGVFAQSATTLPAAPTGLGQVEMAPVADLPAFVDTGVTNQRGDACMATVETNAGVRLLSGFLKVWTPRTPFVDADVEAEAKDGCAAVVKTDWDGVPGSATDGAVVDAALHNANIAYVVAATAARTDAQAIDAYLDDRRGKNASMVDGLGPLTDAWRSGAWQFTTINGVPADATSVKYDDHGNNVGVGSLVDDQPANEDLGLAIDLLDLVGVDASTEPTKRYFKYARPWRWSMDVAVVPTLEAAKSDTPAKDGGFPSGHTAEAWRNGLTMAYLVPQRYQEMLTRAYQLGDDRILAGMHSPMDVIGGRMLGTAAVVYNFNMAGNEAIKADAYAQAQAWLMRQTGAETANELLAAAHAAPVSADRFADHAANAAYVAARADYGIVAADADSKAAVVVPKGAEVLLETRLPYLSAEQRRVVLKTTAFPAGNPVMDDAEGYGRLNYFGAADGYGAFDGDVVVSMDAALGGFNAADNWRNDIAGAGLLSKAGSGSLTLSGDNGYAGGTLVKDGTLVATSPTALGTGDVYVEAGTLAVEDTALAIGGALSLTRDAVLALDGAASLVVAGDVVVDGATLAITLDDAQAGPLTVLSGANLAGSFASVTVNGEAADIAFEGRDVIVTIKG